MRRRLVPLVLVFVVGCTPIAREVCRVSCASAATTSSHAHQGTSHSEPASHTKAGSQSGPAHHHGGNSTANDHPQSMAVVHDMRLAAVPHGCVHPGDSAATATLATKLVIDRPAIVPVFADAGILIPACDTPFAPVDALARSSILHSLRPPIRV